MNKAKKTVVVVGFTDKIERRWVSIPWIEKGKIHYVSSLSEATKYQGYFLIINNNIENKSIIELDKKYRRTFNRFEIIYIYNEKYKDKYYKYARIQTWNKEIFEDLSLNFTEDWDEYKIRKEQDNDNNIIRFNRNKKEKLNNFYNFIKDKKETTTKEIKEKLGLPERTIERYMKDINNIYKSVGYDYSNNNWYFIW